MRFLIMDAMAVCVGIFSLVYAIWLYDDCKKEIDKEEERVMLDFYDILNMIPEKIQRDILDFENVTMSDGKQGFRVTMDRVLKEEEKQELARKARKRLRGVDGIARYKWNPEIQKSYFYLVF